MNQIGSGVDNKVEDAVYYCLHFLCVKNFL